MAFIDRSTVHHGGRVGFLLVHGLGGTPHELRFVAQGLAKAGYTVSCCQLAGHCSSLEDLRASTWEQWYASVEKAHDELKQHCDVVIAGDPSGGSTRASFNASRAAVAVVARSPSDERFIIEAEAGYVEPTKFFDWL